MPAVSDQQGVDPQRGLRAAEFVEASAQQPQSGIEIATLDSERSLVAAAIGAPTRQRMPCRMVEQHPRIMFRRGQIADQQRDRKCPVTQDVTQ
jgi:hypothetical protein